VDDDLQRGEAHEEGSVLQARLREAEGAAKAEDAGAACEDGCRDFRQWRNDQ